MTKAQRTSIELTQEQRERLAHLANEKAAEYDAAEGVTLPELKALAVKVRDEYRALSRALIAPEAGPSIPDDEVAAYEYALLLTDAKALSDFVVALDRRHSVSMPHDIAEVVQRVADR